MTILIAKNTRAIGQGITGSARAFRTRFAELLDLFAKHRQTEAVVVIAEIGRSGDEHAAGFVRIM